jgi:hypothetical protein
MTRRTRWAAVAALAFAALLVAVAGCGGGDSSPPTKESIPYEKIVAVTDAALYPEKTEELLLRTCPGDSPSELLARARRLHASSPTHGPRLTVWYREVEHIC